LEYKAVYEKAVLRHPKKRMRQNENMKMEISEVKYQKFNTPHPYTPFFRLTIAYFKKAPHNMKIFRRFYYLHFKLVTIPAKVSYDVEVEVDG